MSGENDLQQLLKTARPVLQPGRYVFCAVADTDTVPLKDVLLLFREEEAVTLVLEQAVADAAGLAYSFVAAWITMTVHSSLQAVGFTAAFSTALTKAGISCNVVAAYYHDHLFVDQQDAEAAMVALHGLADGH